MNEELIGTHGKGYWMCPSLNSTSSNRGIANRWSQIEYIVWGRRAAWSPVWCNLVTQTLRKEGCNIFFTSRWGLQLDRFRLLAFGGYVACLWKIKEQESIRIGPITVIVVSFAFEHRANTIGNIELRNTFLWLTHDGNRCWKVSLGSTWIDYVETERDIAGLTRCQ